MKMKRLGILLFVRLMALLVACRSDTGTNGNNGEDTSSQEKEKIVIGGKDFTEQLLLSKITSVYLKENGYPVEEASNMGSTVVRSALENGQIDLYWEYTGTALIIYQEQDVETDPVKTHEIVKETDAEIGLVWLDRSEVNNTYALMMREEKAEELGIKAISDLADYINDVDDSLVFSSNAEFYARDDGMKGLQKEYGFEFPSNNVVRMDTGLLYDALKEGQTDVSVGFATDARIKRFDLVVLEDDLMFFPAYHAAPVIREDKLNDELSELLNELSAKLDSDTMTSLNYLVDVEHEDIAEVARDWLVETGFLTE